jgi:tRNA threonylcarbamoyladenosine biosynthesis protein TsaE
MNLELICKTLSDYDSTASAILRHYADETIFALYGKMGAGKTTLIKSLSNVLNSQNITKSPTFTIVNEYITDDNKIINHFDFYRIEKEEEAFDIGFEEYLYSGNYCFIEWSEKIENLLPEEYVRIDIEIKENNLRNINCKLISK